MNNSYKVILVLSDALRYDTAVNGMGYLGHLVEKGKASLYKIHGELPSMSRPMYETIHTGLPTFEHGIVSNHIVRLSPHPNIFQAVKSAGKTTAAAAYYWISELYNRVPYDPINDREVDDPQLTIQHGRFYMQDEYPDAELFLSAATLVRKFQPDYLLIHPMGMDYLGETYGADSSEYRNQAIRQDVILANLMGEWLAQDYIILVTGDHGINNDKIHGGTTNEMRDVPLFIVHPSQPGRGNTAEVVSHLQIAPTVLHLLGLPIPASMKAPPILA
ncbi:MAG: alkaline phosphatase family protein [Chloroflexota bacterium]